MTQARYDIHDNLTDAIRHVEKAQDLLSMQRGYACQSVDVNALDAARALLEHLRGMLTDVDESAASHLAVG